MMGDQRRQWVRPADIFRMHPGPLTAKGVPIDPNLPIMAAATLVSTFGNGALLSTFAALFRSSGGAETNSGWLRLCLPVLWSDCWFKSPRDTLRTFAGRERCYR